MNNNTIERETAKTILEDENVVRIGRRVFVVRPFTLATLVRMSEYISTLPTDGMEKDDPVASVMRCAKDCSVIADIIAVGLIGERKRRGWRRIAHKARLRRLSAYIADTCTAGELKSIFMTLLRGMGVADFFALTTFLQEANVTKQTKVG